MTIDASAQRAECRQQSCRLCAGQLSRRFNLRVIGKYDVQYYECINCRSLQTEEPFWLAEAYAQNLSNLDTGAAQRNLHNLAACYAVAKLFNLSNAIDIGGGDGLLCRLLRDYGINCFVKDKYARPAYAQGFTEPDFQKPDLVLAFEMLEHLVNPSTELDDLFGPTPDVLLLSTGIFTTQKEDWWYLAPESGQHIFFYARKALDLIAAKYDYRLILSGGFILFVKSERLTRIKSLLAKLLLTGRICRLIRSRLALLPAPGVWKDHLHQKSIGNATMRQKADEPD
jgi:hypothetical protein